MTEENTQINEEQPEEQQSENEEQHQEDTHQENSKPELKYSDEDVDKIINEKFAKWQQKRDEEEKERLEAEKFKNMTTDEKTQKRLNDMEAELNAYKEREQLSQMKNVARSYFVDEGISISDNMLSSLVAKDADTTKTNVENYIQNFKEEVEKGINSKLAGKTPTIQKNVPNSTKTKEEIMSIKDTAKRRQMIAEHSELFD